MMSTEVERRLHQAFPSESAPELAGAVAARLGQRRRRRRTTAACLSIAVLGAGLGIGLNDRDEADRVITIGTTVPETDSVTLADIAGPVWWEIRSDGLLGQRWMMLDDGQMTVHNCTTGSSEVQFEDRQLLVPTWGDECLNSDGSGANSADRLRDLSISGDHLNAQLATETTSLEPISFVNVDVQPPATAEDLNGVWAESSDAESTLTFTRTSADSGDLMSPCLPQATWKAGSTLAVTVLARTKCALDPATDPGRILTTGRFRGTVVEGSLLIRLANPSFGPRDLWPDWIVLYRVSADGASGTDTTAVAPTPQPDGSTPSTDEPNETLRRPIIAEDLAGARWMVSDIDGVPTPDDAIPLIDASEGSLRTSTCPTHPFTWSLDSSKRLSVQADFRPCAPTAAIIEGVDASMPIDATIEVGRPTVIYLAQGEHRATLTKLASPPSVNDDELIGTWDLPGWKASGNAQDALVFTRGSDEAPGLPGGDTRGPCPLSGGWLLLTDPNTPKQTVTITQNEAIDCVGPPNETARRVAQTLTRSARVNRIDEANPARELILTPDDLAFGSGFRMVRSQLAQGPAPYEPDFDYSPSLNWTTAYLPADGVLDVWSEPSPDTAALVDWLVPGTSGVRVETEAPDEGGFRRIQTPSGTVGFAHARYLIAQPSDPSTIDWNRLQSMTSQISQWILNGTGDGPAEWLSPEGLWAGGLVPGFGEEPESLTHFDAGSLQDQSDWKSEREFDTTSELSVSICGGPCRTSLIELTGLSRLTDGFSLRPNDLTDDTTFNYRNGPLDPGMRLLASVTVDDPGTERTVWTRTHFFYEFSTGEPKLIGIYHWGSTP